MKGNLNFADVDAAGQKARTEVPPGAACSYGLLSHLAQRPVCQACGNDSLESRCL